MTEMWFSDGYIKYIATKQSNEKIVRQLNMAIQVCR